MIHPLPCFTNFDLPLGHRFPTNRHSRSVKGLAEEAGGWVKPRRPTRTLGRKGGDSRRLLVGARIFTYFLDMILIFWTVTQRDVGPPVVLDTSMGLRVLMALAILHIRHVSGPEEPDKFHLNNGPCRIELAAGFAVPRRSIHR